MKVYICAGNLTQVVENLIERHLKHIEIIGESKSLEFIDKEALRDDNDSKAIQLLVFSSVLKTPEEWECLNQLRWEGQGIYFIRVVYLGEDSDYRKEIIELAKEDHKLSVTDMKRLDAKNLSQLFPEELKEKESIISSLFNKKTKKSSKSKGDLNISPGLIQKGIYCLLGHGGVGKTDYIANMAYVLSASGVRTIIIDLDYISRGINMYYPELTKQNSDSLTKKTGLYHGLEYQSRINEFVTRINSRLDILGTSYEGKGVWDYEKGIDKEKVISLLNHLKNEYDVVLLELDIRTIAKEEKILGLCDYHILMFHNTIYSIYKTSQLLKISFEKNDNIYNLLKYNTGLLLYRFNPNISFDKVRMTEKKSIIMLNSLLENYSLEYEKSLTMPGIKEHNESLYTTDAIKASSEEYYRLYANTLSTFFTI